MERKEVGRMERKGKQSTGKKRARVERKREKEWKGERRKGKYFFLNGIERSLMERKGLKKREERKGIERNGNV